LWKDCWSKRRKMKRKEWIWCQSAVIEKLNKIQVLKVRLRLFPGWASTFLSCLPRNNDREISSFAWYLELDLCYIYNIMQEFI
jgi:hypothetical protein